MPRTLPFPRARARPVADFDAAGLHHLVRERVVVGVGQTVELPVTLAIGT
jgi:hypothetical protein